MNLTIENNYLKLGKYIVNSISLIHILRKILQKGDLEKK